MKEIVNGVWPTMLTAFTDDNKVDYNAIEQLVEWYIKNGADGIFAMCQSSEMFYLSLEEKLDIIKFTLKTVSGRVPVIASGHTSFNIKAQLYELSQIADTGIDALVLITNLLAGKEQSTDFFKESTEKLLKGISTEIPFGLYECPYPFKYLVHPELLRWCAETGRFAFLKDTCCDIDIITEKINSISNTGMKLFNANSATLLQSLQVGASGFSGVMANFHPRLYAYLVKNYNTDTKAVREIAEFLSVASLIEYVNYPLCAKEYLRAEIEIRTYTRKPFDNKITQAQREQINHLRNLTKKYTTQEYFRLLENL